MQRRMCLAFRAVLAGLTVLALAGCGSTAQPSNPSAISADPASLAELRRADPDASRLLGGGADEYKRRLAKARPMGLVVNQWASWCGPCRFELPFFARLSQRYRGRVAFVGVNAQDTRPAARRFLARMPLPFPSYFDPSTSISREFRAGYAWPTTAYYDDRGRLVRTHAGAYRSQAQLERDVRRYALNG